jgi:hypothetical protein
MVKILMTLFIGLDDAGFDDVSELVDAKRDKITTESDEEATDEESTDEDSLRPSALNRTLF